MKKNLLFLPLAVVFLAGCGTVPGAQADDVPVGTQIQNLIKSYIDENGEYTKKTTICFNEDAHKEMDKYFHNGAVQAKRTTYYNDTKEALLMAEPTGSLDLKDKYTDSGYGGYRLDNGKVYRFVAKNTEGTFANMFDKDYMYTKSVASYSNKQHLSDVFVNLSKLAADGYYDSADWGYSSDTNQYYHDLNIPDGKTEKDDRYYPDVLGFAAPMLKENYIGSNYVHIKSIGISEQYDAEAVGYLSIKIYLVDEDSSKLTGECGLNVMSEARIYKGIRPVGEEDSFYLVGTFNDWKKNEKYRLQFNKKEEKYNEFKLIGISLDKGSEFKILSTKGVWHGNWERDVFNRETALNSNYKAPTATNYSIYFKSSTNSEFSSITYVGVETKTLYLNTGGGDLWNKDYAKFTIHAWNSDLSADYSLEFKENDICSYNVPTSLNQVVFFRRSPNGIEEWNKTVDLSVPSNQNCYTITGWGSGTNVCPGVWSLK